MKVVVDTNIIINAAGDEASYAFRILREVIAGRIEAYATHQTMSENRQMLRKLIKDREYKGLVEEYFRVLSVTKVYKPLNVVSDPEDNKLFESVAASGAEYLITEDREVLTVENWHGCEVIIPKDFWVKYQSRRDDGSAWGDWARMVMGR